MNAIDAALAREAAREARADARSRLRTFWALVASVGGLSAWALWENRTLAYPLWAILTIGFFVMLFLLVFAILLVSGVLTEASHANERYFLEFGARSSPRVILRGRHRGAVFIERGRIGIDGAVYGGEAMVTYSPETKILEVVAIRGESNYTHRIELAADLTHEQVLVALALADGKPPVR